MRFNDETEWVDASDYIKENKEEGKKVFSWTLWKYEMDKSKV